MKDLKIGITLPKNTTQSLWSNGITLNILFFAKTLLHSQNNYSVCLLSTEEFDPSTIPPHVGDLKVHLVEDVYKDLDIIVTLGSQLKKDTINAFKQLPNKKHITYRCGNDYLFTAEQVLFKPNDTGWHYYENNIDEVWYVPQQHENNLGYYKVLYRTNAIPVPFVWDKDHIQQAKNSINSGFAKGSYKKDSNYDPTRTSKTIAIMEPNINMIKVCVIPSLVAEECYRTETGKSKIKKLMITNSDKIKDDKTFLSILRTYDLYKDGKITSDGRYQTCFILSQYADILLSHQIFNALNYLYMDAAYLGYPVLHNAWMCKDLGYYYEGSDTKDGAKQLEWILNHHDNHIPEYNERNEKALSRYLATRPETVETYDKLIDNLYNGKGNRNLDYSHFTNLYTNLR